MLIATLAALSLSAATDPSAAGLPDTRWGMTVAEVAASFPDLHPVVPGQPGHQRAEVLRGGRRLVIDFDFQEGRLAAVDTHEVDTADGAWQRLRDTFRVLLGDARDTVAATLLVSGLALAAHGLRHHAPRRR